MNIMQGGSSALETADREVPAPARVTLGLGWVAAVEARERGALFRLQNPQQGGLDVEVVLTAEGPVIRAAAVAVEITAASEIAARCDRFSVDARESFSVRAPRIEHEASGAVRTTASEIALTARTGSVAIRANDDVALNGEQILLNCDQSPPLPGWLPQPPPPDAILTAKQQDGDLDVLRDLDQG